VAEFETRTMVTSTFVGVFAYFVAKLLLKKCFAPPDERKSETHASGNKAAEDADWEASDARESDEGETV
jgi:hypothetical protein